MLRMITVTAILVGLTSLTSAESPKRTFARPDPHLVTESLWPDGAPGVTVEHPTDFDIPQLLITKAESNTPTAGIVILPGGGYRGVSMDNEGYDIAAWMKSIGITSAICTYRVRGQSTQAFDHSIPKDKKLPPGNGGKGYGHPHPRMDAQRAIQTLRARAAEFNIDPKRIGVIGFSAGGHLAATVSNQYANAPSDTRDEIAKTSSRPDFSILCYPVLGMGKPYTHRGSQKNLLGENAEESLIASMSMEDQVSDKTPPTFLFHTAEDKAVPVENSIEYFRACQANAVPAELHVFTNGHHGAGLAKHLAGPNQWPSLCESWLSRIGMLPTN